MYGSCSNDENSAEQSTVDVSKFTKVKRQTANYATVEQKAEELSNKLSKGSTFFPIGGIISGILSVIFGIIMFGKDVGYYEASSAYGGDAYTGIQNAAAQTANNVKALSEITKNGFAFFLIAVGLIAICKSLGIEYHANRETILSLNHIANENIIYTGQVLLFPKAAEDNLQ